MQANYLFILLSFISLTIEAVNYTSQAQQDAFVHRHFFPDKRNGFFCDIGAHDGKTYSNTYFFEKELGWKGICFEPVAHLYKKLARCRNSICINACVSAKEGLVPFIQIEGCDEMLSGIAATFDKRYLDIVIRDTRELGGSCNVVQMPSLHVMKVFAHYGITTIDFLSLDTEGSELEILGTIDFDTIAIKVITVENNRSAPEIRDFLASKGYTFVTRLHVDDLFYRPDLITYCE